MSEMPQWEEMIPDTVYSAQVGAFSLVVALVGNTGWWMTLGGVIREPLDAKTPAEAKREGILKALEELQAAQKMLYQLIYSKEG